jgi:hypothetical protein
MVAALGTVPAPRLPVQPGPDNAAPAVGRWTLFQGEVTVYGVDAIAREPRVFRMDTATGRVWVYKIRSFRTKFSETGLARLEGWEEITDKPDPEPIVQEYNRSGAP